MVEQPRDGYYQQQPSADSHSNEVVRTAGLEENHGFHLGLWFEIKEKQS